MAMTKEQIKKTIIETVKKHNKPINPALILHENGWNNENTIQQLCKLFGVKKFEYLLLSINELELKKDEKNTPSVCLKGSSSKTVVIQTAKQTTKQTAKPVTQGLSGRIKTLLSYLNQNLYGKEEAVRLALLSAVANESIFFMGPPGTAKSMVSRRLAAAFKDFYPNGSFNVEQGDYFEYLMNEFSTPDEICGPVDLSALNETPSRYVRQTEGYLPNAKVAFLDEIWKSGPAILNTLLTIINEKKYHNGSKVEKVPLISLAAASNELPREDQNLDALWDRFILRVFVNPVSNEDDFYKVIDDGNTEIKPTSEELTSLLQISEVENWQDEIQKVELGDKAKAIITAIRQELSLLNQDENHKGREAFYVSDRRWKKIVRILKTSAFLNGRSFVDLMDCSLIEYAIWNTDKQHEEAGPIVEKILKQNGITENGNSITDITDAVDNFENLVKEKWFEKNVIKETKAEPVEYKMRDGYMAYKIVDGPIEVESYNYSNIEVYYLCKNYEHDRYSREGAYYDDNCNMIGDYDYYFKEKSFTVTDDTVSWIDGYSSKSYTCKLKMTKAIPGKISYEPKLFEPVAKKTAYEAFEKEYYLPLLENINNTIAALQNTRDNSAGPFENNLFAEKRFSDIILEQIDDSIVKLNMKKDDLSKLHNSYASDANVKSDFTIGEILLSDGTTKSAKAKVSEEEIIGIVCMLGNDAKTAYALATKSFTDKTYEQALELAKNYGKVEKFPAPYDSGWGLPSVEQWKQIAENIKEIGIKLEGQCWASDHRSDTVADLYNFEKNQSDFNAKSHPFNVYLIRKLAL